MMSPSTEGSERCTVNIGPTTRIYESAKYESAIIVEEDLKHSRIRLTEVHIWTKDTSEKILVILP
jgi:hypothetical protein